MDISMTVKIPGHQEAAEIRLPMEEGELDNKIRSMAKEINFDPEDLSHTERTWSKDAVKLELDEFFELEHYSLYALNDLLNDLNDYSDTTLEAAVAIASTYGYDWDEAMQEYHAGKAVVWEDCEIMEEVARAYAEKKGYLKSIPENLMKYFDFYSMGENMGLSGHYVFTKFGDCVEVY